MRTNCAAWWNYVNLPADAPTIPWAEWKARELNRVFHEQGCSGSVSRITAATVRHGESKKP